MLHRSEALHRSWELALPLELLAVQVEANGPELAFVGDAAKVLFW